MNNELKTPDLYVRVKIYISQVKFSGLIPIAPTFALLKNKKAIQILVAHHLETIKNLNFIPIFLRIWVMKIRLITNNYRLTA